MKVYTPEKARIKDKTYCTKKRYEICIEKGYCGLNKSQGRHPKVARKTLEDCEEYVISKSKRLVVK